MNADRYFVGVTQPAFDSMVGGHARAAAQIDQLAQALWAELNKARLDPSPAIRIRELAARLREQATDLQRRQRLVREMERQKINFGLCTPKGVRWRLPDRLATIESQLHGAEAADLAREAAKGDRKAFGRLVSFAGEVADPAFAKSFLGVLGAEGVIELPTALTQRLRMDMDARSTALAGDEEGVQKALTLCSKALSVGTDPRSDAYVGDSYLNDLRVQGRADHRFWKGDADDTYAGYQSLAALLSLSDGRPPFSLRFMQVVGADMIAYDREHRPRITLPRTPPAVLPDVPEMPHRRPEERSGPIPDLIGLLHLGWALTPIGNRPTAGPLAMGRTDFLNGLLHAAAFGRESSQALLHHTSPGQKNSDLEYLLHERRPLWAYTDHGTTLGQALKSAMAGHEDTAQELFKETSELLGRDIRRYFSYDKDHRLKFDNVDGHADDLSGMRTSLGDVLRFHLDNIDDAFFGDVLGPGASKALPAPRDIDALLAEVGQSDEAFTALVKDEIGRARLLLDQQYDSGKGSHNVLISNGRLLGHILAMRRESLIARGVTTDSANRRLKELINKGIGLIPVPYTELLGRIPAKLYAGWADAQYGKVGDWLFQEMQQAGGAAQQDSTTASDEQAVRKLLRQMSLLVAIKHLNDAGPKASGEPFADATGRILPPNLWTGDATSRFIDWCRQNDFAAPQMSESLETAISHSHDDAVASFNTSGKGP